MAVRTQHKINDNAWFITFTCHNWLPLFEMTNGYDIVYQWLNIIGSKYRIGVTGFVIMPNHVHLLLYLNDTGINLNTVIGNGKRFMAYEIVKRLSDRHPDTLKALASACSPKEKLKGQLHKVFKTSFDAKPVYNLKFLYQKLDYIHHNPVSGKWDLCREFTDYPHSSAAWYERGDENIQVNILDYREHWFDASV